MNFSNDPKRVNKGDPFEVNHSSSDKAKSSPSSQSQRSQKPAIMFASNQDPYQKYTAAEKKSESRKTPSKPS